MILRNMERRALRTILAIGGVAAAVAIVVMGNFIRDAMDHIVHTQFDLERTEVAVAQARSELGRSEQLARQGFIAPIKLETDRLNLGAAQGVRHRGA